MGKIINSHIHLGGSWVADAEYNEEQLMKNMEENGVDGIMVLPLPEPKPNYREMHDRIYAMTQKYPGRVWGVCDIHPRHPEDEYMAEVRRCVKELGFVALKLHPKLEGVDPVSKVADKCFRVARELDIPLMIHTGLGLNWSCNYLVPKAMQYPDLKIVLCHCGTMMGANEAIQAAQLCPNIYLEPSWVPSHYIERMIHTLGADRVVMGSDGLQSTAMELAKAANMKSCSEEEIAAFLGESAVKLYKLH